MLGVDSHCLDRARPQKLVEASQLLQELARRSSLELRGPPQAGVDLTLEPQRHMVPYLHEEKVVLPGHKCQFVILEGMLQPDLLNWLHEDLSPLEDSTFRWVGKRESTRYQNEGGIKIAASGHVGLPTTSSSVNQCSNLEPSILPKYNSLFRAFSAINRELFDAEIHEPLVKALKKFPRCTNSKALCTETSSASYLLNNAWASLQSQRWGPMRMSTHDDGSAGMLLMALQSPAGHRELHVALNSGEQIVVQCPPGHLYLSNISAAEHQVVHPMHLPGMRLNDDLGVVELAFVVRSTWFANDKARCSQGLEGRPFFAPTMKLLTKFLASGQLKIPNLAEVVAEHARLLPSAREAAQASQSRKRKRFDT